MIKYGIQNEKSFLRAHVCVVVAKVYLFETAIGKALVESGRYRTKHAEVEGITTGDGKAVPIGDIPGMRNFDIPLDLLNTIKPLVWSSTSAKGKAAQRIVKEMIEHSVITLSPRMSEVTSPETQMEGRDLVVHGDFSIEVKCDWRGGDKSLGGTGNLFLQIAEINPHHQH